MRLALRALLGAALAGAGAFLVGQAAPEPKAGSTELPVLGTRLASLPEGSSKGIANAACLGCHSADLIRQQRLTAKQWDGTLTKMIGWGAAVPDDQRAALVAYLLKNFGPDNDRFEPVVARPAR